MGPGALGLTVLRQDPAAGDAMVQALALQAQRRGHLTDLLRASGGLRGAELTALLARHWACGIIDLADEPPDPCLVDQLGAETCLRLALVPWRRLGGVTLIVTARPQEFDTHRAALTRAFGPLGLALADQAAIEASLLRLRGPALARRAETRLAPDESCRGLGGAGLMQRLLLALPAFALILTLAPMLVVWGLAVWAVLTLALTCALKLAAACAAGLRPRPEPPPPVIARLPVVSVMVALYRESDIAPRLIRRLGRLDYPRDLLDVLLVVEAEDHQTRMALAASDLPPWMRVVTVPDGPMKTKPRALNFAISQCRGSIIGVYDAEDAPDPDQIRRVVQRFYQRSPQVACLQGVLDFYNPATNWLARCFTIEYATWFRLILPGLERLRLPIPLGGTTLFFRRAALEQVGAWDAHNVTEDADLGMRLYRHGFRTELIDTVTHEEANCRPRAWVKQRSRWLKGYMMTWACHMRDPRRLLADLGWWRFAGFQVLFLGTLSQFLLMPVLLSFWLPSLGFGHPVLDALPKGAILGLLSVLWLTEAVNLTLHLVALRRSGQRLSRLWVLMMHPYFMLGSLAVAKAAWEVLHRPFYWDKTSHGQFDPAED